jgi:hypothetical protein
MNGKKRPVPLYVNIQRSSRLIAGRLAEAHRMKNVTPRLKTCDDVLFQFVTAEINETRKAEGK